MSGDQQEGAARKRSWLEKLLDFDKPDDGGIPGQVGLATGGERPAEPGGGTLFTEPVLVINRLRKFLGPVEFTVFDQQGSPIGSAGQTGGRGRRPLARPMEVRDAGRNPVLGVVRERWARQAEFAVTDGAGAAVGKVTGRGGFGRIHYEYQLAGGGIGYVQPTERFSADHSVISAAGREIARIVDTADGLLGRGKYVVLLRRKLPKAQIRMVIAAVLVLDAVDRDNRSGPSSGSGPSTGSTSFHS